MRGADELPSHCAGVPRGYASECAWSLSSRWAHVWDKSFNRPYSTSTTPSLEYLQGQRVSAEDGRGHARPILLTLSFSLDLLSRNEVGMSSQMWRLMLLLGGDSAQAERLYVYI
jgi:hypothetical protein